MRKVFLALMCGWILSSCSPPPFDVSLEQSGVITQKLTKDNSTLVTIDTNGMSSSVTSQVFYPQLLPSGSDIRFDYASGVLVSSSIGPGGPSLGFNAVGAGGTDLKSYASQGFPLYSTDPTMPSHSVWPMKSGSSIFEIAYDSQNPTNSSFSLLTGNPAAATLSAVTNGPLSSIASGVNVIGASLYPMDAATDEIHALASDLLGNYSEVKCTVNSSGPGVGAAVRPLLAPVLPLIPATLSRCQYFYDENPAGDAARAPNRSYASWYDTATASWKCWAWWENPPGTLLQKALPIGYRVDALLSTGELFSTQDGTGRVFDRDGNPLGTFPLGGLQFIGEEFVSGVARAYFSLSLPYDDTQHFNVYWIQTDQLKTLGN